ncbi:MAG: DUF1302 domain-containing protein [Pseudomonadota bacterium]
MPASRRLIASRRLLAGLLGALFLAPAVSVHAVEFETDNPDLKLRWDNNVKYSTALRLKERASALVADPNQDDGDRNFGKGLISNRLDLLSELDASYKNFGGRISAAAWYDTSYRGANDNNSAPNSVNTFGLARDRFAGETQKLNGRKAELLDAFVSGRLELGDMPVTFRLGRHALIWGESLFFGANGVAAGQAPIDVSKALAVPNLKFNELIRPDNQLSGQVQLTPNLSLGGYYKFSWEENRLPGAGSYFSGIAPDFVAPGANMLYAPGSDMHVFFGREADMQARSGGQGGLQLKYRPQDSDIDFGFYALQYHDRGFQVLLKPGTFTSPPLAPNQIGQYQLVYHEAIRTFGASASASVGNVNFAGEVSVHRNLGLQSTAQLDLRNSSDNAGNPLYAVGNSVQAQLSWIASLGPSFISNEASWIGEVAWNRRTSITKNPGALDPNSTRNAWSLRTIYEPSWRQALAGVDLSMPLALGYTPNGHSSVVGAFGIKHGGDVSIGVNAIYLDAWRIGLNYTHYFGPQGTFLAPVSLANQTFAQSLKDRDFVSISVRRTF